MTNTNMSSVVLQEFNEILLKYVWGIKMSALHWLERDYQLKFRRSLDYKSLGVKNIGELVEKLADKKMVWLIKEPEGKEVYAISGHCVEFRKHMLKLKVQELLNENLGEITLTSFKRLYEDRFRMKLNYHRCGLTELDDICEVFKDILVMREANSGEKAIKAVVKPDNLSKRRRYE